MLTIEPCKENEGDFCVLLDGKIMMDGMTEAEATYLVAGWRLACRHNGTPVPIFEGRK